MRFPCLYAVLLAGLLLAKPFPTYAGGCGANGVGIVCQRPNTHNPADDPFLQAFLDPRINRNMALLHGIGWLFNQIIGRPARWAFGEYRNTIVPGPPTGWAEVALNQIGEEGAVQGLGGTAMAGTGGLARLGGRAAAILRNALPNVRGPQYASPIPPGAGATLSESGRIVLMGGEGRVIPSGRLAANPEAMWSRNLFGKVKLPAAPQQVGPATLPSATTIAEETAQVAAGREAMGAYGHLQPGIEAEIPLRDIIPTQGAVFRKKLHHYFRPANRTQLPEVAVINGRIYVVDGHHRLFAQHLTGAETVPVRIVPLEAPAPGMVPTLTERATTWEDIFLRDF